MNGTDLEKIVKFNELLADCLIFHTALNMMRVLNQLQREGRELDPADVAGLSPYPTRHIRRFGAYVLDLSPPSDLPEAHIEPNDRSETGAAAEVLDGRLEFSGSSADP